MGAAGGGGPQPPHRLSLRSAASPDNPSPPLPPSLASRPQTRTGPISCGTWALLFGLQLRLPNPPVGGKLCSNLNFAEGVAEKTVGKSGERNPHAQPHTNSFPFLREKTLLAGGASPLLCF